MLLLCLLVLVGFELDRGASRARVAHCYSAFYTALSRFVHLHGRCRTVLVAHSQVIPPDELYCVLSISPPALCLFPTKSLVVAPLCDVLCAILSVGEPADD